MRLSGLKPPYPYFGGKATIAAEVWSRFGNCQSYVEPFFGGGATLLARPDEHEWWNKQECVNDADGFICNFWRAVKKSPDAVANWCDWPISEIDLTSRHAWLIKQRKYLTARLLADPDFFDSKIAGWWVWGICQWIGSGWCSGDGAWHVEGGRLVKIGDSEQTGTSISNKRPSMAGIGVHKTGDGGIARQRPIVGTSVGVMKGDGVSSKMPGMGKWAGINRQPGVSAKMPSIDGRSPGGTGINRQFASGDASADNVCAVRSDFLRSMMETLANRLRRVRVCCGDWSRIMGPAVIGDGIAGIMLDPPYSAEASRDETLYSVDDLSVAHDVRRWCIENGGNPNYRIALCGYEGEHDMPGDWEVVAWKAAGGYSREGTRGEANAHRERIWFSPACIKQSLYTQPSLLSWDSDNPVLDAETQTGT